MEWVDKSHITKGIGTYIVIFILMLIPNVFLSYWHSCFWFIQLMIVQWFEGHNRC